MRRIKLVPNFFLLIWPLMSSIEAWGHGYESMARSNFEIVALGISVNEGCPLDEEAALVAAEAEFLRARIKIDPLKGVGDGGFWLNVRCAGLDSDSYVYSVDMEWTWEQGGVWPVRVLAGRYGERNDGAYGLQEIIGDTAEKALTIYLKANIK